MLAMGNATDAMSMWRAIGGDSEVADIIPKLVPGEGLIKITGVDHCIPVKIPKVGI